MCLTVTALAMPDARVRRLCIAAMLVGAAGLAIALIAGTVGPVAILLQGQAWRWMWVTGFISVLLVIPTAMQVWTDRRGGPMCAALLVVAWTFGSIDGLASADAALGLWLVRPYLGERTAQFVRWAGVALVAINLLWVLVNCWGFVAAPLVDAGRELLPVARLREIFGRGGAPVLLVVPCWYWLKKAASPVPAVLVAGAMCAASWVILPGSLKQPDTVGTPAEIAEFADWRAAIPPTDTVLMLPTTTAASFMWFTLGRPSYLSLDQSSGVIFSQATALEVRRRSTVLAPLGGPDWKILTAIMDQRRMREAGPPWPPAPPPQELTADILAKICGDPRLGFVIAEENVGYGPLKHRHIGPKQDWNLYDCRRVRSQSTLRRLQTPTASSTNAPSTTGTLPSLA